ncbi:MarR family winged helix-turn-helix transcriptional regulator [Porphyrobacter sp. CACIAM 03H1]|jgi:hypothetical protein|uniref:MarR family winged helix-turn-helix transcriptional regulator n=1 Tax=Porphyrobacter sp. CACIAM 03H1 TaxID=2003315 RepID=UPI001F3E96FB|nr:MarR family winged helix-turn-helix transcriptional regulator [Porphyrobacter sp. CACIAM 03H1]
MGKISGDTGADARDKQASAAALFHPLAEELMAIAERLRDAAEQYPDAAYPEQPASVRSSRPGHSHLVLARKIYALRRKRASIFGNPDLFGEPAWDILLDLYIAQGEGKQVSVSSACIGSAAPATTGLRWLSVLADQGLVVRENDPEDHRRVLVRLTGAGLTAMDRFFEAVDF